MQNAHIIASLKKLVAKRAKFILDPFGDKAKHAITAAGSEYIPTLCLVTLFGNMLIFLSEFAGVGARV